MYDNILIKGYFKNTKFCNNIRGQQAVKSTFTINPYLEKLK